MLTEELKYFEIYNGHPGVRNYGDDIHVSTERMWDILLALRLGKHGLPIVYGMASDDAHAASTVKFTPPRSNRFATRPARDARPFAGRGIVDPTPTTIVSRQPALRH